MALSLLLKVKIHDLFLLTLKCLRYFSLPFVHKGVHLDQTILKYFPVGKLVRNLHHIYVHVKQP